MKLYTFEPINWHHCGGAICVAAKNFENAATLLKETSYEEDEDVLVLNFGESKLANSDTSDQWILTNELLIPEVASEGVLVNNWNHS